MPNLAYRINVNTPCPGNQVVNMVASTHYVGSNGDFTYAILTRSPSETRWRITIYDYSGPGPCSPNKTFDQVDPAADDPTGDYSGGNDDEQAFVADFP